MRRISAASSVLMAVLVVSLVAFAQQDDQDIRRESRQKALAYWQRANARRLKKQYEDALKDYEKAAEAWQTANNNRFAQVTRQMVTLCQNMPVDLKKLKDGAYTGTALGYSGDVTIELVIKSGRMSTFKITDQRESRPLKSLEVLPEMIGKRQSPSVDVVSGATVTSYGVMCATLKALEKAKENAEE